MTSVSQPGVGRRCEGQPAECSGHRCRLVAHHMESPAAGARQISRRRDEERKSFRRTRQPPSPQGGCAEMGDHREGGQHQLPSSGPADQRAGNLIWQVHTTADPRPANPADVTEDGRVGDHGSTME